MISGATSAQSARAYFRDKMPAIGRADNGAAARHDPAGGPAIQNDVIAGWKQAFETIYEAEDFEIELLRRERNAAQNRVQTGAIAAAGENADPRLHGGRSSARIREPFSGSTTRPAAAH